MPKKDERHHFERIVPLRSASVLSGKSHFALPLLGRAVAQLPTCEWQERNGRGLFALAVRALH